MATPLTPDEERLIRGDVELGYDTEACDVDRLLATLDAARAERDKWMREAESWEKQADDRATEAVQYLRERDRYRREALAWREWANGGNNLNWMEVGAARAANEEAERG